MKVKFTVLGDVKQAELDKEQAALGQWDMEQWERLDQEPG